MDSVENIHRRFVLLPLFQCECNDGEFRYTLEFLFKMQIRFRYHARRCLCVGKFLRLLLLMSCFCIPTVQVIKFKPKRYSNSFFLVFRNRSFTGFLNYLRLGKENQWVWNRSHGRSNFQLRLYAFFGSVTEFFGKFLNYGYLFFGEIVSVIHTTVEYLVYKKHYAHSNTMNIS